MIRTFIADFQSSAAAHSALVTAPATRHAANANGPFARLCHGLLLAAGLAGVASQAAAATLTPATFYDCVGRELTVRYATAAATGVASMVITLGAQVIKARGNDVLVQATALGPLVTVRNGALPDSFTDTLSLLAPDVNVPVIPNKLPAQFLSSFHSTRTLTSVGGPALVQGVIQQSSSQPVICTPSAPSSQATQ